MIVSYAAKKMRSEMPDPGMKKARQRDAVLNELMLGPDTENIIDRLQSLLSLLRGHMITELVGTNADKYTTELKDVSRLLEVIRNEVREE